MPRAKVKSVASTLYIYQYIYTKCISLALLTYREPALTTVSCEVTMLSDDEPSMINIRSGICHFEKMLRL